MTMLPSHRPPSHPGEVLEELYMKPLALTQTRLAEHLKISRNGLNEIIRGKRGISPEMACKLGDAFRTGPEMWINLQVHFDLWHARAEHQPVPAIA